MLARSPGRPAVPETAFVQFRMVAFGGSAGGIPVLLAVLSLLPEDFPIPIVVVQHLAANLESRLPEVLGLRTKLRCKWAEDGETPLAGCVHVAPRGGNLTVSAGGRLHRTAGRKPRLGWPSVDLFLGSVAAHLGGKSIAVVLSGMLHDGAQGIWAVRQRGGATMVQHPGGALHPGMPSAAVDLGRAELRLSLPAIARSLLILAERGVE